MPSSSASAGSSGGKVPGRRAASIDLPEPGGPVINRLWLPAGGDFERALGALLAFDVPEVEPGGLRRRELRFGRRQELRALEMIDDREKVRGGDDLDLAGPGGFAAASGADEPALTRRCGQCREQYP